MAFIGDVGGWVEDTYKDTKDEIKRVADDVLGIDDSGGVVGSVSDTLADIDDGLREVLTDETVMAVAQVALVATGNAWAVPILQGASVAAAGGDVEQVLKAAAVAYVAQQAGAAAGEYLGQAASEAAIAAEYGIDATSQQAAMLAAQEAGLGTTSALVGSTLGRAGAAATSTAILGGDVKAAFIAGGISGAVPAILGNIEGYESLDPKTQNVIASGVTSVLRGTEGGALTESILTSVVTNSQIVADTVTEATAEYGWDADQQAFAATMATNAITAGLTGQPIPDALRKTIAQKAMKDLGDTVKSAAQTGWDKLTGDYATADEKTAAWQAKIEEQQGIVDKRNILATSLNDSISDVEDARTNAIAARDAYVAGNMSKAKADKAIKAHNDLAAAFQTDYDQLLAYDDQIANFAEEQQPFIDEYKASLDELAGTYEEFNAEFSPVIEQINKNVVETLDPKFDADIYIEQYGNEIPEGMSAHEHWLQEGQHNNAVTSADNVEAAKLNQINRLYAEVSKETGIDMNRMYIDPKLTKGLQNLDLATLDSFTADDWDMVVEKSGVSLEGTTADGYAPKELATEELNLQLPELKAGDNFNDYVLWWGEDGNARYVNAKDVPTLKEQWSPVLATTADTNNYGATNPNITEENLQAYEEGGLDDLYNSAVNALNEDIDADIIIRIPDEVVDVPGSSLQDYGDIDPEGYLTYVQDADKAGVENVDKGALDYAKSVAELVERYGDEDGALQNTLANAYRATGGILKSFNGIVLLAGANPADTALGKFADNLVKLGEASNTEDYQKTVGDIKKQIEDAEGFGATVKAIYDGYNEAPIEFLAEYIGVEAMQEIVPLLVGGGVGTAAKGLALARGASTKYANIIGLEAGLGAARTSDVIESFGGTAESTYEETYALARQQGYSEAEAAQMATETAVAAGVVSSGMTLLTMGVGGDLLEKSVLGDAFKDASKETARNALAELGIRAAKGVGITVAEGVTEGIEEGATQVFIEGQLYRLDPTRDIAGNIAAAITLGSLAGGTISGGAYGLTQGYDTGKAITNIMFNTAETGAPGAVSTNLKTNLDNNDVIGAYSTLTEGTDSLGVTPLLVGTALENVIGPTEDATDSSGIFRLATIESVALEVMAKNAELGAPLTDKQVESLFAELGNPRSNYASGQYRKFSRQLNSSGYTETAQYANGFMDNRSNEPNDTLLLSNVLNIIDDFDDDITNPMKDAYLNTKDKFTVEDKKTAAKQFYDALVNTNVNSRTLSNVVNDYFEGGGKLGYAWMNDIPGLSPTNGADLNQLLDFVKRDPAVVPDFVIDQLNDIATSVPNIDSTTFTLLMDDKFFDTRLMSKVISGDVNQLNSARTLSDLSDYRIDWFVIPGLIKGTEGYADSMLSELTDEGLRNYGFSGKSGLKTALEDGKPLSESVNYLQEAINDSVNYITGEKAVTAARDKINAYVDSTYSDPRTRELVRAELLGENGVSTGLFNAWYDNRTSGRSLMFDESNVAKNNKAVLIKTIEEDLNEALPSNPIGGYSTLRLSLAELGFDFNNLPKDLSDALTNYGKSNWLEAQSPLIRNDTGGTRQGGDSGSYILGKLESGNEYYDGTNGAEVLANGADKYYFIPSAELQATIDEFGMDEGTKALFERLSNVDADDYADANLGTTVNELITNLGEVTDQGFSLGPKVTAESVNDLLPSASVADLTSFISQASTYTDADIEKIFTDAGYNPSEEEISRFTGEYQNQLEDITQYVDENSATLAEIEAVAAEEGITDLAEAGFYFDGLLPGNEGVILNDLRPEFDRAYTTEQEARDFFDSLGFTPTDEQVAEYIGNTDDNANAEIAAFVDANQVTEAEALAKFAEYGYTPTAEEIAEYTGQIPQGSTFANIESYADPRALTENEIRTSLAEFDGLRNADALLERALELQGQGEKDALQQELLTLKTLATQSIVDKDDIRRQFEREGYEVTDEQVDQLYDQFGGINTTDDGFTNKISALAANLPNNLMLSRFVTTADEAKQWLMDNGISNPTDEQIARFTGQINFNALMNLYKAGSNGLTIEDVQKNNVAIYADPRVTTEDEARQFFTDFGILEPTDEQLSSLTGEITEADVEETISGEYGANEDFVRQQFEALGYEPTDEQVAQFVFQNAKDATTSAIGSYVDPRQVTVEEVAAIAEAEGLTLDEAMTKAFVGQSESADFQTQQEEAARAEFDPLATTLDEAKQFFADTGYTATPEELGQFVAAKSEAEQQTAISGYVDPRQVTEAEAAQFLQDLGYEATADEVAQFIGQGAEADYQESVQTQVSDYIDPRQVTEEEARQFFTDLGYEPTDEQVQEFIGQVSETDQADNISKYVDPRQVTADEIAAIAEQEGLTFEEAMAEAYIGQSESADFQTEQETAAQQEFDPLSTTLEEAQQFFADTGYSATPEELASFVASKTEVEQQSAIGEYIAPRMVTEADAQQWFDDLGYTATPEEIAQFVGQVNDETYKTQQQTVLGEYVDPRMVTESEVRQAFADAGLANPTQSDVQALMGQYEQELLSGKVDTTLPDARYNALYELVQNIGSQGGVTDDDLQAISDLIGKQTQDVTDTDIDFVTDLIAQQEVLTDPMTYTPEQLGYDVTGDGIIDSNDLLLMQQAQGGQEVEFAQDSKFAQPTGIYDTVQDVQTNLESQIDQQQDYLAQGIDVLGQTMGQAIQDESLRQTRMGNLRQLQQMILQEPNFGRQQVDVKTPDPAKIGYIYDFESIFANPQQAGMFPSPYAEGGYVEDDEDELYKLLGE